MLQDIFIVIAHLCHSLGTVLAHTYTMTGTDALKYKYIVFYGTDIDRIYFVLMVLSTSRPTPHSFTHILLAW